jgi:high-affinity nickel-transport protein
MITFASVVALGFLLGMRHATDVDHVLAVATIVSRERKVRLAALVGALWGLGHTLTIVVVGVPIVLFNWVVVPRVGLAMEFGVGLMLILLGLRNLCGMGTHPHNPQDTPLGQLDRTFGGLGLYQATRPIVVGIVHGLAGSAGVALLVLTTIQEPRWAVAYLLLFGLGTVAGMVLITSAISLPFARTAAYSPNAHHRLRVLTGALSFGFGLFLAYRIGIVDGLFALAPRWVPQ